jgi:hypothetical protein
LGALDHDSHRQGALVPSLTFVKKIPEDANSTVLASCSSDTHFPTSTGPQSSSLLSWQMMFGAVPIYGQRTFRWCRVYWGCWPMRASHFGPKLIKRVWIWVCPMPPRAMLTHMLCTLRCAYSTVYIAQILCIHMLAICVGCDVDAQDRLKWCCTERVHLRVTNKSFST